MRSGAYHLHKIQVLSEDVFPHFIKIALQRKLLDLPSKTTNGNNITTTTQKIPKTFIKLSKLHNSLKMEMLRANVNAAMQFCIPSKNKTFIKQKVIFQVTATRLEPTST